MKNRRYGHEEVRGILSNRRLEKGKARAGHRVP
jgi:hypothetical protein